MKMLSWRRTRDSQADSLETSQHAYLERYAEIEEHLDTLLGGTNTEKNGGKPGRQGGLFPDEFHSFHKPEPVTLFTHAVAVATHAVPPTFSEMLGLRKPANAGHFVAGRIDVLLAMSIIRYVDNFLDETLWPRIAEYKTRGKGEELRAKVERLLAAAEELAAKSGTYLSHELTELPRLELAIELDPSSFDQHIISLVEHKSLDIQNLRTVAASHPELLRKLARIRPSKGTAAWTTYAAACIADMARDFGKEHEHDTDFNLRRVLLEQKGNLNTHVLIEYVRGVIEDLRSIQGRSELPNEAKKSPASYIPRLEQFVRDLERTYEQARTLGSSAS